MMSKAVLGLFSTADISAVVREFKHKGFGEDDLSIISSAAETPDFIEGEPEQAAVTGALVGAFTGGAIGAAGTWASATIPGFESVLATGFITTAAGSVLGSFLGSLFSVRADSRTYIDLHEALAAGDSLLIVQADKQDLQTVVSLMEQYSGRHIEVHNLNTKNE